MNWIKRSNAKLRARFDVAVFCLTSLLPIGRVWANDLTLSVVPVGGPNLNGGTVDVEVFLTANVAMVIGEGRYDLACVVSANPGGAGTLTVSDASANFDGDADNDSSDGVPYVFGDVGFFIFAQGPCIAVTFHPLTADALIAGQTGYLGTFRYNVSDCAAGDFSIGFECTDQPGGLCDKMPEPTNTTRFRIDPPDQSQGPLIPLTLVGTTLSAPPPGACCDGHYCLADHINEACCFQNPEATCWFEGRTCADAAACAGCALSTCIDDEFCDGLEIRDPSGQCPDEGPPPCDDGNPCTIDDCLEQTNQCVHAPLECSDGQFCNGLEICDPLNGKCQTGPAPNCDDGVVCTVDSCNEATNACDHLPNDAQCDDGLFCTGTETCDTASGCRTGENPCPPELFCDEASDACVEPTIPTVSEWGLVALALLFLAMAKANARVRSSRFSNREPANPT